MRRTLVLLPLTLLASAAWAQGLPADSIAPGELIITEIMQNPDIAFDNEGEWFEVLNASGRTLDLDGLMVLDDGSDSFMVVGTLSVANGGVVVFGNNGDPLLNGGVTVDYVYTGMTIANGADEVVLANFGGEIEAVRYDGGPAFPDPTGASMSLDPAAFDDVANDDGANWCEAPFVFGAGDFGSPGQLNPPCFPPTLLDPVPGIAGQVNDWDITSGPPFASVVWVRSLAGAGVTPLPGGLCPGLTLDVANPKLLGSGTTDAAGDATHSQLIPGFAAGATVHVQAVFPNECVKSNVVTTTF